MLSKQSKRKYDKPKAKKWQLGLGKMATRVIPRCPASLPVNPGLPEYPSSASFARKISLSLPAHSGRPWTPPNSEYSPLRALSLHWHMAHTYHLECLCPHCPTQVTVWTLWHCGRPLQLSCHLPLEFQMGGLMLRLLPTSAAAFTFRLSTPLGRLLPALVPPMCPPPCPSAPSCMSLSDHLSSDHIFPSWMPTEHSPRPTLQRGLKSQYNTCPQLTSALNSLSSLHICN